MNIRPEVGFNELLHEYQEDLEARWLKQEQDTKLALELYKECLADEKLFMEMDKKYEIFDEDTAVMKDKLMKACIHRVENE
jgi:hypothetical protein